MAAYVPPPSPGHLRSSRTQALKMGTAPSGFEGQIDYDVQAGVPRLPGFPTGVAQGIAPQINAAGAGAVPTPVPFALKK